MPAARRFRRSLLLVPLVAALGACDDAEITPVCVTPGPTLTPQSVRLAVGDSAVVAAPRRTGASDCGSDLPNNSWDWRASRDGVVSLRVRNDTTVVLTGLAPGQTTVIAALRADPNTLGAMAAEVRP